MDKFGRAMKADICEAASYGYGGSGTYTTTNYGAGGGAEGGGYMPGSQGGSQSDSPSSKVIFII
jgi:hypothetical protein